MASKPGKKGNHEARAIETDPTAPIASPKAVDLDVGAAVPVLERTILESDSPVSVVAPGDYQGLRPVDPGDYQVGDEIARGGMGRILEGRDRRVGRSVAIKEVLLELLDIYPEDERALLLRRFEREARITARLEHPAIVPVYEIGRMDDAPFFAMKKVDGEPLDKRIAAATSLKDRLRLLPNIIAVAEALGYAHDRGVIHRDLKPANVLIGAHGETVVIDWGLAKQVDGDEDPELSGSPVLEDDGLRTVAGAVFGTPLYMPPEQARGEPVDRSGDVYAIGSLLYHLLAGKPAYSANQSGNKLPRRSVLEELKAGPPQPLVELESDIPPDLVSIIEKSMARDPAERYASAVELASDLRQFEAGQLVAVHDYSAAQLLRRWVARHRAAVATAVIALVTLVIVGGVLVQKLRGARDGAETSAVEAEKRRAEATRLFTELGRGALLRDRVVEGSFALIQARWLGATVPGLDVLLAEIDQMLDGVLARIEQPALTDYKVSRDGKTCAIGLRDGTITLYDIRTARLLSTLKGPSDLHTISLSRDGSRIAVAAGIGPVQVWDAETQRVIASFTCTSDVPGPRQPADAALTPSGKILALGCHQDGVTMHSVATGEKLGYLPFPFPQMDIEFTDDGAYMLLSYLGTLARVFDMKTGALVSDKQLSSTTTVTSYTDDLRYASSVNKHGVDVFDLRGPGSFKLDDVLGNVTIAVLSPNGQFAILGGGDGLLARVNLAEQKVVRRWRAHPSSIYGVAISPDSKMIASLGEDMVIRTWDADTQRRRFSFLGATGYGGLQFSSTGNEIVAQDPDGLLILDTTRDEAQTITLDTTATIWLGYGLGSVLRMSTFESTWLRSKSGTVTSIDGAGGTSAGRFLGNAGFSLDGRRVATRNGIYDARSSTPLFAIPEETATGRVVLSADGTTTAVGMVNGDIHVYDVDTGNQLQHIAADVRKGFSQELALNKDGSVVVTASMSSGIIFVDVKTGEVTTHYLPRFARLHPSNDGTRMVVLADQRASLWNLETRTKIADLNDQVIRAAISGDGKHAVLMDRIGWRLSLYDGDTGQLLRRLRLGPSTPQSSFLTLNGGLAAAVDEAGSVRLWDITSGLMIMRKALGAPAQSVVISDDGSTFAAALDNSVSIFAVNRTTRTAGDLLLRLRNLYPQHFFIRNFLVGP